MGRHNTYRSSGPRITAQNVAIVLLITMFVILLLTDSWTTLNSGLAVVLEVIADFFLESIRQGVTAAE